MSLVKAPPEDRCDGTRFRAMVADASTLLACRARVVDALNVFPVPDGDTGTNMVSTMRAAVQAAEGSEGSGAGAVAEAVARGALMGAHGNSGAILSQYLRGLARGLEGCLEIDGPRLARALDAASSSAQCAVDRPVEGTMLTVARDAARAAADCARTDSSVERVLSAAAREAIESVERTRGALPVLQKANVVDAGALGLATILEGLSLSLRGEPLPLDVPSEPVRPAALDIQPDAYGYCTEFVIRGVDLDLAAIRSTLRMLGDSVVAIGDETTVRVHLHTFSPTRAIEYGTSLGAVDQIKVDDMQEQNRRLRECGHATDTSETCGLIVVTERGFADVFDRLGATRVIELADERPALSDQIARTVREIGPSQVVVLVAEESLAFSPEELTAPGGSPTVVMARDPARALTAALAFQAERSAQDNARAMQRAMVGIRTARVVRRDSAPDGERSTTGEIEGAVDGQVVARGTDVARVTLEVLDRLGAAECEVITLYPSEALARETTNALVARVRVAYSSQEVETIWCGQFSGLLYLACE